MRFDYLHSGRPLFVQRMLEFRIPDRFFNALCALGGAIAFVTGAWTIEAYRLQEALKMQAVYQAHYDATQRELKQANVYYSRVRALVDLDRRVRGIAASGDADARTLADIANELPQHAWLTGISHDAGGLALEGRAKDLSVVSGVMRGLMRSKRLHNPTLETAAIDKEPGRAAQMKYEVHVEGSAQ
jgi:Tfp pilus assembly protein PilN